MSDLPKTIRELRTQVVTAAARGTHVFDRTLHDTTPAGTETNRLAHWASFHGYALAELLRLIELNCDPEFAETALYTVNDIAGSGDDGRSADVWPDVQARLKAGGVGTPEWDAKNLDRKEVPA